MAHIPRPVRDLMTKAGTPIPAPIKVSALIDTGASASCIREDIAKSLGLNPVGVQQISTPSTTATCAEYFVALQLPSMGVIWEGKFIATPLPGQNIACLIGRDLLSHGVLVYNGQDGSFTFCL